MHRHPAEGFVDYDTGEGGCRVWTPAEIKRTGNESYYDSTA
ncbi:hypothetical protein [Amycolatopsis saalfeldensis]|nr:hypothetical protein [Amycolatopsis saalfeldensis]